MGLPPMALAPPGPPMPDGLTFWPSLMWSAPAVPLIVGNSAARDWGEGGAGLAHARGGGLAI